ncbi:MAG TPA: STAS domain-containing protein, partial [Verrucomicrobiae bacterium]
SELLQSGYRYFVLELSDCVLMDSTFLGVLAGFGLKLSSARDAEPAIELLNPNARISDLLDNLGVLHLFKITHGPLELAGKGEMQVPCAAAPTREEVTRACLEAHRTLMEINPANVSKFKEVTQFLAEDLKRIKEGAR